MQRGVVYGVLAGALWGMVFLVPRLLTDFSPLLLSAGRYAMYGLVSLAAALPAARSLLARLTREDLVALVRLAVVGNVAYYMLLSGAVHLIGIAPSSLIVGVLPVTVTLAGLGDHGALQQRQRQHLLAGQAQRVRRRDNHTGARREAEQAFQGGAPHPRRQVVEQQQRGPPG